MTVFPASPGNAVSSTWPAARISVLLSAPSRTVAERPIVGASNLASHVPGAIVARRRAASVCDLRGPATVLETELRGDAAALTGLLTGIGSELTCHASMMIMLHQIDSVAAMAMSAR